MGRGKQVGHGQRTKVVHMINMRLICLKVLLIGCVLLCIVVRIAQIKYVEGT